ncbi:Putative SNF2-domain/RING finger domain/helicase domain protein [Zea mays]|uniref:Putative SNF2-domain/RING finger domain/helicase domain protein n=1 Tax=Zea mays TaxID=4577 RepID=A0A1D6JF37_MAIZE|nr:Putative SNF2-domain/RING finger domain/helicase domain protein [Zea mays]
MSDKADPAHMLPSNMDIIDLSSDGEQEIIDLSSDSEDNNTLFRSYREDYVDYDDPGSPFHLPFFPHNTAPDWNIMEELDDWRVLAKKEYDDWLSSKASSSYSPVDDILTTEMNSKQLPQSFTYGGFIPQSCAPGHSSLGDNRTKEEPSMTFSGFQGCTASGNGMPSSTVPIDDIFVYGGPRPHRIFPPPMPSSVNDIKVEYDVEQRLFSSDERAVYEEALKHITQETKEEDLPKGVMSVLLLKHQKIALAWMLSKENCSHCPGGILADDQGLGKTISTIALIQKEMVKQSRFMTAGSYSTKFVPNSDYDNDSDVVIDMDKKEPKDEPLNELDGSARLHVASSLKLCDSKPNTATDKAEPKKKARVRYSASNLRSKTRPAAGTLVVCPASVLRQWANELSVKVMEDNKLSVLVYHGSSRTRDPNELATYDVVVTTYMTVANEVPKENSNDERKKCEMDGICPEISIGSKRKKQSKPKKKNKPSNSEETLIDGEPILKLPPKTIQLNKIDFTQKERAFYLTLEEGSRQKFKAYDAAGTIRENYANILVLLLRLRQACDHPLLLNGHESDLVDSSSIERAKQLPKETVTNLIEKLERGPAICSICNDPPEDAVVTTCGHVFCYQCVHERLTSDGHVCPYALCGNKLSFRSVFTPAVLKLCTSPKPEFGEETSCSTAADKPSSICESSYISSKIRSAVEILNSIIKTPALTAGDTTESIPSMAPPVKAIVFSQWTGMLDLLELSLNRNGIQFRRLDGAMSLDLREKEVNGFKTDPEVRVMLMSLKAGNLGLNMVAACHVIMLDPWWNPYAEDQAVDRAHRIGQTRPVTVSRFTVKDTVEDRILALQEKKREMVESAFGEDGSRGTATKLTVEDLRYLFMV